jgi:hypothetical protein
MKIDRNVPLPDRIAKRFRIGPLPLAEMNVGDSFVIEIDADDAELSRILHSLRVRLNRFTQKNPKFKFSSSKDKKGLRVWRF